jgi:hypothetical protein
MRTHIHINIAFDYLSLICINTHMNKFIYGFIRMNTPTNERTYTENIHKYVKIPFYLLDSTARKSIHNNL